VAHPRPVGVVGHRRGVGDWLEFVRVVEGVCMTKILIDRAVVEQALEALEGIATALREEDVLGRDVELLLDAGTNLRAALAEPQEPVQDDLIPPDLLFVCAQMGANVTRVRLAEPVQEPVAWRVMLPDGYQFVYDERMLRFIDEGIHATRQPLYTSPPQRPAEPVQEPQTTKENNT
jgi:hypothetical protein